ncbi:bifunctional transcriptional activator/DNA repair enzyme AdaA [Thalassotalea sp. PLHSN55]|uniref:bifunctional transcriptional activator/DNA repair enzyme AdaA n=1 Tax=Thalassotalea sp. PLHSN55 TaxID=3435888 RepID=UPI003F8422A1
MAITEQHLIKDYYQALVARDTQYVGVFYVGVKTTNIFCIASCRARKPKFENVEFYTSVKEVMSAGFRPCKICKPTENSCEAPNQVQLALALVKENPTEKITDFQLKQKGVSPELIRRWFNKNYGMTFQAYQRMFRINNAYQSLKKGKSNTEVAFDNGYESLSGFGYTFKKIVGKAPSASTNTGVILISRVTTPLGPMFICATENGICLLEFVERKMLETEFKQLQQRLNSIIVHGENKHIVQARQELDEYFQGQRQCFSVAIESPGTDFQQQAWQALMQIPYGQTVSYQAQAKILNKENAVRAIANANGCNRIAIIVPCHRVIGKNGHLTGYAGGLARKQWLLDHEAKYQ